MDTSIEVRPGDILLLCRRGVHGGGNLLAQALARGGRRRFARVAVVVNDELVADAMPRQGVQLRRWRDMAQRYDLAASRVARHAPLAAAPDAASLVFQRASHFYRLRYDVKPVLREQDPQAQQPCAQFLGALYGELGLRPAQASEWSHEVDAHTRHGLWQQYPLGGAASPALPALARWQRLPAPLPPALLRQLQRQQARSAFQQQLQHLQQCAAQGRQQAQTLVASRPAPGAGAALPLGGDALLADWLALYRDGAAIACGRQRQMRQFDAQAAQAHACLQQLRAALAAHGALVQAALQLTRDGLASLAMLQTVGALTEQLLAWGDALCDDDMADEALLRIQAYPQWQDALQAEELGLDEAELAHGAASLAALRAMDLVRLDWVAGQRCALLKSLPRLQQAQHALAPADAI